jgi:hypothetical protein
LIESDEHIRIAQPTANPDVLIANLTPAVSACPGLSLCPVQADNTCPTVNRDRDADA